MGNNQSSSNNSSNPSRSFQRPYALGLSRSELDARCKPSGLYKSCQWEDRAIRRLIGDGKAASRLRGKEVRTDDTVHECPICFLYYAQVNVTKCCNANICTECFLQVRPQKEKHSTCPFCNHHKFAVSVQSAVTEQDIMDKEKEEQTVHEARLRCERSRMGQGDSMDSFGSSLESDERIQKFRSRSDSIASSEHSGETSSDTQIIQSLAMTPQDRARLEDEMRNQNLHPLALQVEAEAEQRRSINDRVYSQNHLGRNGSLASLNRGRRNRDWNSIVEACQNSDGASGQNVDDLVVLEAAFLLSMEEESRHGGGGRHQDFDAASHVRQGFPHVRSFLSNRNRGDESSIQSMQPMRHNLTRSDSGRPSAWAAMPQLTIDSSSLLLQDLSEEEQIAMAIAASMQDQSSAPAEIEEHTKASAGHDGDDTLDNHVVVEAKGQAVSADKEVSNETKVPSRHDGISAAEIAYPRVDGVEDELNGASTNLDESKGDFP